MQKSKIVPAVLLYKYSGPGVPPTTLQTINVSAGTVTLRALTDTVRRRKSWPLVKHQTLRGGTRYAAYGGKLLWNSTEAWRPWQYWYEGCPLNVVSTPLGAEKHFANGEAILPSNYHRNVLRTRLLSNLKKTSSNIGVTLAEGTKTASWMATRTSTLCRSLMALKRGRFNDFWRAVNEHRPVPPGRVRRPTRLPPLKIRSNNWGSDTASRWLEWNYAVMPIVYDVSGAMDTLRTWHDEIPVLTNRARASWKIPLGGTFWQQQNVIGGPRINMQFQVSGVCSGRMAVYYTIDTVALRSAARVGLVNPATVAWELVPFSFVVDWVVPIGTYLDNLDADLGLKFESGYEVWNTNYQAETNGNITDTGANPARILEIVEPAYRFQRGFTRHPLHVFPVAIPYIRNPMSFSHSATTLALIRQLWRFR